MTDGLEIDGNLLVPRDTMFIGSPEGYTTIERVPGATPDAVRQVSELMIEAANAQEE